MPSETGGWKDKLAEDGIAVLAGIESEDEYLETVSEVGTLVPQYDGRIVWPIKADPKFDDHYHSLNTKALNPHTECYEFTGVPPRYLALWCVQPNRDKGGETTLADGYAYVGSLEAEDRDFLETERFEFHSSSGIQASDLGRTAKHAVFDTETLDHPIFRFSYNCMDREGSARMARIADGCVAFFDDEQISHRWSKGDLLIWDNHRVLHSRSAYSDRDRELRRVWLS